MLIAGAYRTYKFVNIIFARECDVDLLARFKCFSQQASSFVRQPQCVLPPFDETRSSSCSIPTQAAAQLEVACPIFWVLRDEHLSMDRPVGPFFAWRPAAAAGFDCKNTAAILLADT